MGWSQSSNNMNRKLADIERYLRTWQGQISNMTGDLVVDGVKLDSSVLKPFINKVYSDVKTIVDGVKQ